MCGIFGTIGPNYRLISDHFVKQLAHRGPDSKGAFFDDQYRVSMGHTRLSIIDLSDSAHQPMQDASGTYTLVFNGEVYNYLELRAELELEGYSFNTESDTEVVLNSFIAWGAECLSRFRGMFAFCVYDSCKGELFLARDRFGIKPLLYSFSESAGFVFSSELKPFLTGNFFPRVLSSTAANDYFRFGSVRQPFTFLDGVFCLMPGHLMRVRSDLTYHIESYYDLVSESLRGQPPEAYEDAIVQVRDELERSTRYHMISDVPVGAFLSGGVDSTAVVALMNHYTEKAINTFCVGFREKESVPDETAIATRTAARLGTRHTNIHVDDQYVGDIFEDFIASLDQPSIDGINSYIVSRETSKELKVAVSGLGGDEIFAGYPHFSQIVKSACMRRGVTERVASYLNGLRPNRFSNSLARRGLNEMEGLHSFRTIADPAKILNSVSIPQSIACYHSLSSVQQISKGEIEGYMLNTLLRDSDVLSMAHSLEVRPVLLDHKLVELAFRLDDRFKIRGGNLKSVFVDSVKDLIPEEVWKRKKTGFEMPFSRWMNGQLNEKFSQVSRAKQSEVLFRKDYLRSLQNRIRDKKLSRKDWMSLILMSWIERYDIQV
ncbi:asparagine synthase (glutamine-hydrolyzing) [Marinobacter nauticus]